MKTQISDTKREEIVSKLQQDIDAANAYYEETVEPKIIERYQIYNADKAFYAKMFPKLSKRCELVSTDVQDTIESTMPSLMKTFHGSTDVVTIQGADGTDADDARAEKMQELINYQLQLNHSFMVDYQWMKDALITNGGIVKVDWVREYKPTQQTVTLDAEAYAQYRPQADAAGIKVIAAQPVPGGFSVTIEKQEMSKNQPRIMNVLASEFRFSPDATNLADADFVAHRKIVTLDYLRKQQDSGMYEHVDELTEKATNPHYTTLDEQMNEIIGSIWTYDLKVGLPRLPEKGKNMDYKFPLTYRDPRLPGQGGEVPDVSLGSSAQKDIVDFAFKLVVMCYLDMLDWPMFLDELGASFDEEHRYRILTYIKQLVLSQQCSQVFYISHYASSHAAMSTADITVLDSSNVTVPRVINQNVIIK